uniref:Uncharacterized protein n=1 Tax=Oryza sativa subsp. japonica TaxID=39947 RepID=Q5W6C0_ORYSJ|nr:hypothetical protein [Oryza sativa Japonica Group]
MALAGGGSGGAALRQLIGSQTGDMRRSYRRERGGQTGGGSRCGRRLRRSNRLINIGQTGGIRAVRPADQYRSDRLPSNSRLGRGKKEYDGRIKDDDMNKKKNVKEKEKKKHCMQWLIQELIKVFDESEDEDESKGKQVVDLAFIASNASSDVDESDDDDNEEKLSYDQLEHAAYKFAKKLQTCSIVLDEKDHTIEILNAEIARLKSLIPNDDECKSCEVLFSEINALRDVNSVNCKKLEFEIENSKKLECSFALGFALYARVVDELILTKNVLKKYKVAFCASSLVNASCANKAKQNNGVLISQDCSKCVLNELKLKDALGRVKHMEEIVKQDEVFSCSTCRKQKGLLDACKNCAILTQEVSYLKSYLQRFYDGKKNFNMILDQSKKKEREIAFAKRRWQKSGFNSRTTVRPTLTSRSDRPTVRPQVNRRSDQLPGPVFWRHTSMSVQCYDDCFLRDYHRSGFGDNQFSGDEQGLLFCRDRLDQAEVAEFFDLYFTGFRRSNRQLIGGQTGDKRRSDRRRQQVRQATSAVRPVDQYRSERWHPSGQTGRSISRAAGAADSVMAMTVGGDRSDAGDASYDFDVVVVASSEVKDL